MPTTDPRSIRHEDERIIQDALSAGKISAASADGWRRELAKNRDGVKALIDGLASTPSYLLADTSVKFSAQGRVPVVDAELESVFAKVTGRSMPEGSTSHTYVKRRTTPSADLNDPGATTVVREIAGEATASFAPTTVKTDAINARINADPELQRVAWAVGIRDGINAPPHSSSSARNTRSPGTRSRNSLSTKTALGTGKIRLPTSTPSAREAQVLKPGIASTGLRPGAGTAEPPCPKSPPPVRVGFLGLDASVVAGGSGSSPTCLRFAGTNGNRPPADALLTQCGAGGRLPTKQSRCAAGSHSGGCFRLVLPTFRALEGGRVWELRTQGLLGVLVVRQFTCVGGLWQLMTC